ncbi:SoxR reducing system RseC family protein [Alkalithermobacter paradoxus]|uniref:SoxR reducing system protein RseC n=1 Tax=Alkalithermobacter paradoxus TaxID=29349 RepID=A0A1V4I9W1_9FIRM|nr:SoxR reducing system protein RseC [[Clostridium] thermoalcaliphilum]
MKQSGVVIEKKGDIAYLNMQRHSACGSCGACGMGSEKSSMKIEAINKIDANIGDFVEVDIETVDFMKAAFIIYTIPLVSLLIGVILSNKLLSTLNYSGNIEVISFIVGIVFMAGAFFIVKLNEKRLRNSKKYMPVITSIIK